MSRASARHERIEEVRASRDWQAVQSAKALLLGDMTTARDYAERAAEDEQEMTRLRRELRTQPTEPGSKP